MVKIRWLEYKIKKTSQNVAHKTDLESKKIKGAGQET